MTKLQVMAAKHIARVAQDVQIPLHSLVAAQRMSADEIRDEDQKLANMWSAANGSCREIVEWANALAAEARDE